MDFFFQIKNFEKIVSFLLSLSNTKFLCSKLKLEDKSICVFILSIFYKNLKLCS